ncbi:hypothetical protein BPC006_II2735 [Burkholderia pseudomallei BPC006]|nr:hypothetical protein BPC006_I0975 [Burkholderia pseudomallei BPC006]AFR14988.1 hypothetical protein BPC006_I1102 [Burkholderia pseudomallei BPC006]AFR16625.1 hypothetical protein BPC006_I2767 [Burkholderia pseudomallei BPC006]AFR16986.1 hypothetical protein BPC006_I3140 [Burkholderia pseudomallei BPC006]AFR17574.1 hypothetical protein BPC006_I3740 [Burkholderia pseudomallei BPC006]
MRGGNPPAGPLASETSGTIHLQLSGQSHTQPF